MIVPKLRLVVLMNRKPNADYRAPKALLSRDEFRRSVFDRDGHCCVICGAAGVGDPDHASYTLDAHHIVERRLWTSPFELGGYFVDNGSTLCTTHHREAERTTLSCEDIRTACGIERRRLPEHLYADTDCRYDKWGNIILPSGARLKGELFFDESVQKILSEGEVLALFGDHVKYPRTYHLPWSHPTNDDKMLRDLSHLIGCEVVVTEKMDGENSNLYRDHYHARSMEEASGPDRARVKAIWSSFAHDIPAGWRVCGENLYAKHSILYTRLPSYLLVFSIWNERNVCLPWDETVEWCDLWGLQTVPVLYRGPWDETLIRSLYVEGREPDPMEGYVARVADGFPYGQFKASVAKFVRKAHVTTNNHWRHAPIEPNGLAANG